MNNISDKIPPYFHAIEMPPHPGGGCHFKGSKGARALSTWLSSPNRCPCKAEPLLANSCPRKDELYRYVDEFDTIVENSYSRVHHFS